MKIIADENIPLVHHYFSEAGDIILKPGRLINRQDLLDADILLVRSVTSVTAELLHDTKIKFVGSTTIGQDHLDTQWLDTQGIHWTTAKGCNATAVVEYVISVIAAVQNKNFLSKPNLRAAVIGVGTIGSQVVRRLKLLGFDVVQYDPVRAAIEKNFQSIALKDLSDCDLITLHTPLTTSGRYPTFHLIEKFFLQQQKPGCFLLNCGRGSVVNFDDLKKYGSHLHWCLDVWENEPNIDLEILEKALIATPHIAGYSVQSKYRGIQMIYQAAVQQKIIPKVEISIPAFPRKVLSQDLTSTNWRDVVLKIFNPFETTQRMKNELLQGKQTFDDLRKNFGERYEFDFVQLERKIKNLAKSLKK